MAFKLNTAGTATQIVGSPTPPQNPPEGKTSASTLGYLPDTHRVVGVEVLPPHTFVLDRHFLAEHRRQPEKKELAILLLLNASFAIFFNGHSTMHDARCPIPDAPVEPARARRVATQKNFP